MPGFVIKTTVKITRCTHTGRGGIDVRMSTSGSGSGERVIEAERRLEGTDKTVELSPTLAMGDIAGVSVSWFDSTNHHCSELMAGVRQNIANPPEMVVLFDRESSTYVPSTPPTPPPIAPEGSDGVHGASPASPCGCGACAERNLLRS